MDTVRFGRLTRRTEEEGMLDPVERMVKFVMGQKQEAVFVHARSVWAHRLPALLPCLREVVEVFHGGLDEASEEPVASVLVDPRHERCRLVIAFERRNVECEGILRIHPDQHATETGASAVFRCEEDGIVYGFRYPFHSVLRDVRPERFVDLGDPSTVQAHQLGNAVADFLEWASVGAGCGNRKMRFWSPSASLGVPRQPNHLGVVAA
jgi:hypothetical protein